METAYGFVPGTGETIEEVDMPFVAYAARLRLSVDGRRGELIRVPAGTGGVTVRVECPGEPAVRLTVNGEEREVALENGAGDLVLSCAQPGRYVIAPADRVRYCAAGEAVSVVEVTG